MSADPMETASAAVTVTVIELRGRGRQLIERFRTDQSSIRIGRAFDNDLVVDDEFVSPHHVRLDRVDGHWKFEDLESLNGLRRAGASCREGVLHSGDVLSLGHTTLHVYDEHHPTGPALRLEETEGWLALLGSLPVVGTLIAISMAWSVLSLYWGSVVEFKLHTSFAPVLTELLLWTVVAAVWALVGRLLRHRAHFAAHLSLWLGLNLLHALGTFLSQWIAYNVGSQLLEEVLDEAFFTAALTLAIWGSFALASGLRSRARIYAAVAMSTAVLAFGLAERFQFDREFSSRPEYYGRIQGPSLLWATPVREEELLEALPELFDRADQAIEEDEEESADEPGASQVPDQDAGLP